MARLPALIDTFVKIDGRDRTAIEHTARVIREIGWIPTTKRGSGASLMTSAEAVNLLLALNGASSPKDAPDAVKRLRQLQTKVDLAASTSKPLGLLHKISGFGEALEYLIDAFPAIAASYGRDVRKADEYFFDAFFIGIEIHLGYAIIRVGRHDKSECDLNRSYHLPTNFTSFDFAIFDRRVVIHLTGYTIFALWHCVAEGLVQEG